MSAPENVKSWLSFRKKALEAELLSSDMAEQMREYIDVCSALIGIENSGAKHQISSTEFMPYANAIDAMEAYLDKVNEFTDQEVVIQALLDGGWKPLAKKRRSNIIDGIRYARDESKRLIVIGGKDGKIGKADWGIDGKARDISPLPSLPEPYKPKDASEQ